jgi:hypothetical protein
MPLDSAIVKRTKLTDAQKERMFLLHCRYFCNVQLDIFLQDLSEKDWVIMLQDTGQLVGFSTQQVFRLDVAGTERIFLFSGDTIVEPKHWQDSNLAGCFGHLMLRLINEYSDLSIYWLLISKGFRTYRFLPVYFKRFYPVHSEKTPPEYADLMRTAARHKFREAYDAEKGIVQLGKRGDRLKPEMCVIPAGREKDPHVRFFLARNPAFSEGDELVCLADISRENLNQYAWRAIKHTTVDWHE